MAPRHRNVPYVTLEKRCNACRQYGAPASKPCEVCGAWQFASAARKDTKPASAGWTYVGPRKNMMRLPCDCLRDGNGTIATCATHYIPAEEVDH